MSISDNLKDHILDSIAEGVFTVDKDFKINFFNKAAEKITGYKRDEVLGNFCKNVFRSQVCYSNCPIAIVLRTQNNLYDFESVIKTCVGDEKTIKLNAAVLYNDLNVPVGGIVSFRNLYEFEAIGIDLQKETFFNGIIGHSRQMKEIFELIEEISETDAPVFIQGESGTGKELVANAIQKLSNRKNNPFVKINCSIFPSNLLASELFGHVKGAFTDAFKDRPGRFEVAEKGTIFLDEVAEMPLQMQIQLLRVLQEGTFERVGESITRRADVRVIAATNINIKDALKKGQFREDLFYRLNVIPIVIPPLRERPEDIIPLVKYFLNKFSLFYKKQITELEEGAFEILLNYQWPGNIRELENAIEYAFVRTIKKNIIESAKLPVSIIEGVKSPPVKSTLTFFPVSKERADLLFLLEKNLWNKSKVAKELNIGRTTLWRRMKKLGLTNQ
ncbi:MAG: sigma-54-dependent Fis family transcriptional regulator [Ignavibacteriae bacterium HGW-Ignavibacteriae-3]|nr:MAG: sigma-54-dependent Fis family transcriptional regulator [Ignavibacteriae bacterium HGW-Ignavibacteriae-3]